MQSEICTKRYVGEIRLYYQKSEIGDMVMQPGNLTRRYGLTTRNLNYEMVVQPEI